MSRLALFFGYTCLLFLTLPPLLPDWKVTFFAPFLVLAYYQKDKIGCLWLSVLCGFTVDLFSAQTRLGFHAFNYCLVTTCLYPQTSHFFEENLSTLPIMTFLFALLSTCFQALLFSFAGNGPPLSVAWFLSDVVWLPLLDACYASLLYLIPLRLFPYRRNRKPTLLFSSKEVSR